VYKGGSAFDIRRAALIKEMSNSNRVGRWNAAAALKNVLVLTSGEWNE